VLQREGDLGIQRHDYLVFEGLDVVGQTILLADAEIYSLEKPADGVGLRVRCY
jgi:hypothetical protein